ncbi:MAG: nitroreductase [Chitinophagaceae bacterium]|nr:nitroreductase [Bacteroidota bacterium]MCC6257635.1 nitroreductase [Chitinophagaceae bacterium]MCW5916944.1 nitroreductase [Ferruginibacter sp.]
MNPVALNELIASRRSVYTSQFVPGKVIPEEIIRQILENACWAPNHGNKEPWQFQVYSGNGLKKLANLQAGLYKQYAGEGFKEIKYEKLRNNPLRASHIISIGMKRTKGKQIPEVEDIAAVACAVENIYLSVTAYGLGGYWTTGGITYMEEAKPFFGLDSEDRLMGFFYLGYIAIPSPQAKRSPMDAKVSWIKE